MNFSSLAKLPRHRLSPIKTAQESSAAKLDVAGRSERRVVTCYSVFDSFFPKCGFLDLTEGIYTNADTTFDKAQRNQHQYLLDQVHCQPNDALLDVGCGYGTLMARARSRGARPVGITLSPEQVQHARRAGLDVRLLDYKNLDRSFDRRFDAIIANGSAEHFVQPQDAAAGKTDAIYRNFFRVMRRSLKPDSAGRMATTIIHFHRRPDPADMLRSPLHYPRASDDYHYALLMHSFGGWYPEPGQLERCAQGYFRLVNEVDGTDDYRRSSEFWLSQVRRTLRSRAGLKIWAESLPTFLRHPLQFSTMFVCMLVAESWNWQFRGADPPTRLLRQTWSACR